MSQSDVPPWYTIIIPKCWLGPLLARDGSGVTAHMLSKTVLLVHSRPLSLPPSRKKAVRKGTLKPNRSLPADRKWCGKPGYAGGTSFHDKILNWLPSAERGACRASMLKGPWTVAGNSGPPGAHPSGELLAGMRCKLGGGGGRRSQCSGVTDGKEEGAGSWKVAPSICTA